MNLLNNPYTKLVDYVQENKSFPPYNYKITTELYYIVPGLLIMSLIIILYIKYQK